MIALQSVSTNMPLLMLPVLLTQTTFDLGYLHKVGDALKFNISAVVEVEGRRLVVTGKASETVLKGDEKAWDIESRQYDGILKFNNNEQPQPDRKTTKSLDAAGVLTGLKSETIDADAYRRQIITTLYLPKKSYKVGETWSYKYTANGDWKSPETNLKFKLIGQDETGVHIVGDCEERGIRNPMKVHLDFWIDPTNSTLIKEVYSVTNLPIGVADTFAKATIEMRRASI